MRLLFTGVEVAVKAREIACTSVWTYMKEKEFGPAGG
jgi:hypothetical protein